MSLLPLAKRAMLPFAEPCPHCDGPLEFHQLDPDAPAEIIANCPECRIYYLDLNLIKIEDIGRSTSTKRPA
jgi:hypothetical protein